MREIIKYLFNMLPYMLCALPFIAVFRYLRVKKMAKRGIGARVAHEAGVVIFLLFLTGLASQTVIPKIQWGDTLGIVAGGRGVRLNLVPFLIFRQAGAAAAQGDFNYFLINFVGNIVLFMPIGFFIPLLWRKVTLGKMVLIGFLCSLFIELCQLPLGRGTDIDDLWLNTLGCLLGYAVFALVRKLAPRFAMRCKVGNDG